MLYKDLLGKFLLSRPLGVPPAAVVFAPRKSFVCMGNCSAISPFLFMRDSDDQRGIEHKQKQKE